MARLVENVYSQALFDLCAERGQVDAMDEQVKIFVELLDENPEFLSLLTAPEIAKEEKLKVIAECFGGRFDDALTGFLTVLVRAGRQSSILKIFERFRLLVRAYRHRETAVVTTAQALDTASQKAVLQRLLEITPYDSLDIHYQIDPEIIGGMIIRIGDRIADNSIRRKLELLSRSLL